MHKLKRFIAIKKIIQKENYDIIIVHHEGLGTFGYFLFGIYSCPNVMSVRYLHCSYEETYLFKQSFIHKFIYKKLFWYSINKANLVVAVSEFVKYSYSFTPYCKNRIQVIYNGVESKISHAQKGRPLSKILYIGRIEKVKGIKRLIEAVENLLACRYLVTLTVVGDGAEKECYESYVQNKGLTNYIKFTGYQVCTTEYYEAADIFVYPSICQEAFGLSIIEAMAVGVICLASNVGGIPEIIKHGQNGFLFDTNSNDSLTEQLKYILNLGNSKRLNKIRENAMLSAKYFNINNTINQFEKLCAEVMK